MMMKVMDMSDSDSLKLHHHWQRKALEVDGVPQACVEQVNHKLVQLPLAEAGV